MDKRIIKTKRNIKQTMIRMLGEKRFEDITVKELCETAETSRITFYTHYSDKTELANDIINDMIVYARTDFHQLQSRNNPANNIVIEYLNILDCILDTYYANYEFFLHAGESESPMLSSICSKFINEYVGSRMERDHQRLNLKYPISMTRSFLCSGIRGFILSGNDEAFTREEISLYTHELLNRLLDGEVLRK